VTSSDQKLRELSNVAGFDYCGIRMA